MILFASGPANGDNRSQYRDSGAIWPRAVRPGTGEGKSATWLDSHRVGPRLFTAVLRGRFIYLFIYSAFQPQCPCSLLRRNVWPDVAAGPSCVSVSLGSTADIYIFFPGVFQHTSRAGGAESRSSPRRVYASLSDKRDAVFITADGPVWTEVETRL